MNVLFIATVCFPLVLANDDSSFHLQSVLGDAKLLALRKVFSLIEPDASATNSEPTLPTVRKIVSYLRKVVDYKKAVPLTSVALLAVIAAAWPFVSLRGLNHLRDLRLVLADVTAPDAPVRHQHKINRAFRLLKQSTSLVITDFASNAKSGQAATAEGVGLVALDPEAAGSDLDDESPDEDAADGDLFRYTISNSVRLLRRRTGDDPTAEVVDRQRIASHVIGFDSLLPGDHGFARSLTREQDQQRYSIEPDTTRFIYLDLN